ncbi:ABC transporter permease [Fulvivirgaceae bacterium PWU4]|uniref:ABC transporter permease n=1 Tax=Chryseosolibacter histidini TaxID=2782349 RepID=A0AAP2DNS0_9BACT|nr:ABC transporter permease [Chryseosolibacter histidini]MBT1698824.1 ABC transporter permease [Chryseosolibacter histidini]
MIKNYILISFRNLRKHFPYALINISGLGLGLATCLLLVTWITHELSYDRFHTKADRIYRGSLEYGFGGRVSRIAVSPTALLPAMLTLPEAETGVRVYNPSARNAFVVKYGEKLFLENDFYAADSTFFDVFTHELVQGDAGRALADPYTVVITESMARKYFGNEDAIGKTLLVNNVQDYTVTGVVKDVPSNSLLQFDFVASFHSMPPGRTEPSWWSANYQTFVVLQPNADLQALADKTNNIVKEAVGSDVSGGNYVKYNFTPLTDLYLKSDFYGEPEVVSDIRYVYIFTAIAILVLVIACINYVNLSTARATDRAREVGVRKIVGALRNQLFVQFIGESLLITTFAFCFAYMLALLMLPLFNELTGKTFSAAILFEPSFAALSIVALVAIAMASGAYPALAIASFKPVSVLKGNFRTSGRGIWLRKSLVVIQFGISVVLITGTLIIVRQLDFIQGKKLGYDRENTIILSLDAETNKAFESLSTELLRSGAAVHVGRGSESPVNILGGYSITTDDSQGINTTGLVADEGYIPAMGIEIIAGRNFTKADLERAQKDTAYVFILNESALTALYIDANDAIGMPVTIGERRGEIVGVVRDFHFASLHENIGPLAIFPEQQFNKVFIRMPQGDVAANLDKIRSICASVIPHRPFDFEFLDQQYSALYANEQRMGTVFIIFATLAIIIACLGLLGLVSFSAAQKTKEIGIRKVLGATAGSIVVLITKDFTKLVLIAIALGLPLAYWAMSQWLDDFAYKTDIGIWPTVIASSICITIALGTAGYQAIKAALVDPARTLRNE